MDGSSVVLHTRFSSVVFPAFALPITRIRKQVYVARSFAASSGSIVTAGVGAAGGAVTTGGATTVEGEFERLGGVLCDPSPKTFFSRLRSPLDSLTVCLRSSAISMRVSRRQQTLRLRAGFISRTCLLYLRFLRRPTMTDALRLPRVLLPSHLSFSSPWSTNTRRLQKGN